MDAIGPVMPGAVGLPSVPAAGVPAADGKAFQAVLQDAIERVAHLQVEADGTLEKLRLGQATEPEALAAFQKARVAMETMTEIRNRIVAAFNEIQQMQV